MINYKNEILVEVLESFNVEQNLIVRQNHLKVLSKAILIVSEGGLKIIIEEVEYCLSKNDIVFLDLSQSHSIVSSSEDFKADFVIFTNSFLYNPLVNISSVYEDVHTPNTSAITLTTESLGEINGRINNLKNNIQRTDFLNSKLLVIDLLSIFIEVSHLTTKNAEQILVGRTIDRKKAIVHQFKCILARNCKKQHLVSFYAGQLAISSEYLTRILKIHTGKNANDWIDEALIKEAKYFLHNTDLNIQQISTELFFSDQSSFSKYFKKHTNQTPKSYRQTFQN